MKHMSTKVCMTKDIGVHDNLFGGNLMSWMDEAAACYACLECDTPNMITLKVSEILFKHPIKVGDIVSITCETVKMGTTSITIKTDINRYKQKERDGILAATAELVFVRIDGDGESKAIDKEIRDRWHEKQN